MLDSGAEQTRSHSHSLHREDWQLLSSSCFCFLGVWLRSCLPSPPHPEAVLRPTGRSFHEDKSCMKPLSIPQMEKEEPPSSLRSEDSTLSAPKRQQRKQSIWSVCLLWPREAIWMPWLPKSYRIFQTDRQAGSALAMYRGCFEPLKVRHEMTRGNMGC